MHSHTGIQPLKEILKHENVHACVKTNHQKYCDLLPSYCEKAEKI